MKMLTGLIGLEDVDPSQAVVNNFKMAHQCCASKQLELQ